MRAILQGTKDQHIGVADMAQALIRERADICAIDNITDAEAERLDIAMDLPERLEPDLTTRAVDGEGCLGCNIMHAQDRRIA